MMHNLRRSRLKIQPERSNQRFRDTDILHFCIEIERQPQMIIKIGLTLKMRHLNINMLIMS